MLMQRVLTALVLLPLLLAAVWLLPTVQLYAVFAIVGVLIAWEWAALMKLSGRARFRYAQFTALFLASAWLLKDYWLWLCLASVM